MNKKDFIFFAVLAVLVMVSGAMDFRDQVANHIDYCQKVSEGKPNYDNWPAEECSEEKINNLKKFL